MGPLAALKACSHFPEQKAGALALEKSGWSEFSETASRLLPFHRFVSVRKDGKWLQKEWQALAISGALTDRMFKPFFAPEGRPHHCSGHYAFICRVRPVLRRFYKQGGREIRVLKPIRLLQVAVNPESPDGYSFPPGEMKEKIGRLFFSVPVVDVMRDRHEQGVWCDVL